MDTPDRNLICTPKSRFEDSPVFNYINSLSPIKPVKSVNIAQTFNSLSFSSPPSVFTSPHVSNQKESRFLRRHYVSEAIKCELTSENIHKGSTSVTVVDTDQVLNCSEVPLKSLDSGSVIGEVAAEQNKENLELAIELPRTLKYDCGSPENNPTTCHGFETDAVPETSGTSTAVIQLVEEVKAETRSSFESGAELQETCQLEEAKEEGSGCEWENMISDTAGLLLYDSSNDVEASKEQDQKLSVPETSVQKVDSINQVDICKLNEMENPATLSGEGEDQMETDQIPNKLPTTFQNKEGINIPSGKMADEVGSSILHGKQRGTRRRCLVFEKIGAHKRNLMDENSSTIVLHSGGKSASDDKQLVPFKVGTSSSPCMLPGIGLHLNALATTPKDPRVVKHESLSSGRQIISMPSRISSFHSVVSEEKPLKALDLNSMEIDTGPAGNDIQIMQNASLSSSFGFRENFNDSSSPKKKRRRLENDGESEACKRCNCKKSKCLKLYCECFAAGVYCVEPCSCLECFNKPIHEDTVLATRKQIESRNPLAFAPKVIRTNDSTPDVGEESNKTPASARHKRGCNCKKSSCLKKYCECYQGGVGCSINCRCEGCKNAFGRKDGSVPTAAEEADQEEETDTCEKSNVYKRFQMSELQKDDDERFPDHVMPMTPFQICRMSVQLEFSSMGKPPRSSKFPAGSSTLKRSNILPTPLKLEKQFQVLPNEETPEILRSESSPIRTVKTSPNGKRVSPPHHRELSPGRRSSRKLVLQSIPSFPSLTFHEPSDQQ